MGGSDEDDDIVSSGEVTSGGGPAVVVDEYDDNGPPQIVCRWETFDVYCHSHSPLAMQKNGVRIIDYVIDANRVAIDKCTSLHTPVIT